MRNWFRFQRIFPLINCLQALRGRHLDGAEGWAKLRQLGGRVAEFEYRLEVSVEQSRVGGLMRSSRRAHVKETNSTRMLSLSAGK